MMQVTSKKEMYRLYQAGKFGNKLRTWDTWQDMYDDPYQGDIVVRSVIPGYKTKYKLPKNQVLQDFAPYKSKYPSSQFRFNEAAPDQHLLIQGEVYRSPEYLSLFYSTAKLPMKPALAESGRQVYGATANAIMRYALNDNSWDDMQTLLDIYDGIIEFSAYEVELGVIPGRNTIIWEIRTTF
jgi:hypothetical protein